MKVTIELELSDLEASHHTSPSSHTPTGKVRIGSFFNLHTWPESALDFSKRGYETFFLNQGDRTKHFGEFSAVGYGTFLAQKRKHSNRICRFKNEPPLSYYLSYPEDDDFPLDRFNVVPDQELRIPIKS